jgi:apolipoprotein D and lipocalin family protein
MIRRALALAVLALLVAVAEATAQTAPIPLAKVEMDRMYGGWFLIATIPNWFEKGIVAPYDVYSKRPDGDIREDFYFQSGSFEAPQKHFTVHDWVLPGTNDAHWRVQVLWPINLPFLVLYVDPQYRYVLFGENDRQLGWIYARSQTPPESDYRALLDRFASLGYDKARFVRFVQKPSQIGQPGYWSEGIQ